MERHRKPNSYRTLVLAPTRTRIDWYHCCVVTQDIRRKCHPVTGFRRLGVYSLDNINGLIQFYKCRGVLRIVRWKLSREAYFRAAYGTVLGLSGQAFPALGWDDPE